MIMKTAIRLLACICLVVFICGVDISDENSPGMTLVGNAEAIIGMPFTPLSYAGVARRTTRRVVYADTAVVASTAAAATASAAAYNPPPQQPPPQTSGGVPIGTVVQSLPGGCKSVTVSGTEYHDCGGSFYKTAFQGNNLVYVTVANPLH
jgi:hypothetical protein